MGGGYDDASIAAAEVINNILRPDSGQIQHFPDDRLIGGDVRRIPLEDGVGCVWLVGDGKDRLLGMDRG